MDPSQIDPDHDAQILQPIDEVLAQICDYVLQPTSDSLVVMDTARYALLDALGCGLAALRQPACLQVLGPMVPGTLVPHGSRVPGTSYVLDPAMATFNLGAMIRWQDFNDTWLAQEWSHPSDNLAGLLMTADHLSQLHRLQGESPIFMKQVLQGLVKAYEIQGVLALSNSLNRHGLDHVLFVKVATAAVVAALLGGDSRQICTALSLAWVDNVSLRTYRHAPNVGWRKSWAAADAGRRGVEFAWLAQRGEQGYPTALSAPRWGVNDVIFSGTPVTLTRPLGTYVMENVLFKAAYPAEFHAQTALEAAIQLHPLVAPRWREISRIDIVTHESALRIIDKKGPLRNPADRDHSLQYIVALGLLFGTVTSEMYEDAVAADFRIDWLRDKMMVVENIQFSEDYIHPHKRSVTNSVQVTFADGSQSAEVRVEYPLGHPRRRQEALPKLLEKFHTHLLSRYTPQRSEAILAQTWHHPQLEDMPVDQFVSLFLPGHM
ncbi:bifunctional 2-methylcitrate dehydratase/aconitate hydratase [Alicyclobacillaceae bacterium I2511]|nr:bifunctional 2-methylcitrate dehydratase/aconitate hydratase [Alicyclobacillaceae bacterium I2511]